MVVPIATSPGRSEFGPELTLSYDSGAGNGRGAFMNEQLKIIAGNPNHPLGFLLEWTTE